jgi:predicted RNase H-like HicB family nuclease
LFSPRHQNEGVVYLAFSRNNTRGGSDPDTGPLHPQKVVIVAGPSFGSAVEFMLLGVAIGVAGTLLWQKQKDTDPLADESIVVGGASMTPAMSRLLDRAGELAKRAKVAAASAKETVRSVGETLGPTLSEAIAEGKTAAQQTQEELAQEIRKNPAPAPDTASIAGEQA